MGAYSRWALIWVWALIRINTVFIFYLLIFTAPSGPPLNIAVTGITSTSVTVSWDPPIEPNGKIMGYKVKYHEKDISGTKILDAPGQGYTIENLKPFRIYRISVACKSSGGIGRYSDEIENQTLPDGESLTFIIVKFRAHTFSGISGKLLESYNFVLDSWWTV